MQRMLLAEAEARTGGLRVPRGLLRGDFPERGLKQAMAMAAMCRQNAGMLRRGGSNKQQQAVLR